MNETGARLKPWRVGWVFLLAYLTITVIATAFSIAIESRMQVPDGTPPLSNPAYLLAERFFPVLNLFVWVGFAGLYFRKRMTNSFSTREALVLGAVWLGLAVVVDYVGFVLIKNPISLSPHDFYIGQAPWIYLIYAVVLVSPWVYIRLAGRRQRSV
jgi:hypothetical protein